MDSDDKSFAEDIENDHNKIMTILAISYAFKTFKLIIIIFMISYFLGIFFYIFSDLTRRLHMVTDSGSGENFIEYFGIESKSTQDRALVVTYYAFTSLSTVGFGDLNPRSDPERIMISMVLLFGVAIFSYIMGNFINII